MEESKIPDPPAPPPEIDPAGSLPGANPAGAAGGPTPEEIAGAADTYAGMTAFGLDLILARKGKSKLTEGERAQWGKLWIAEVRKRPALAVADDVPEAGLLIFLVGVFAMRKNEGPPAETEAPATAA